MKQEWPKVKLREVLRRSEETVKRVPDKEYREITVRMWGKGVVERGRVRGSDLSGRRFLARAGQFIVSRIDARHGAMGLVPATLDCALVTNDFPLFDLNTERLEPEFFGWLCRTASFIELCKQASEGTTNRVRMKEERFFALHIPLPPLTEQRRIMTQIEDLVAKINDARALRAEIEDDLAAMLGAAHYKIANGAPTKPLSEVAPLKRRPVTVELDESYPQVAVRSFGRGTFHKPPIHGSEITWQKPFRVEAGDILVSNIKAWEGALAVATLDDHGRVGSHRYLTFVPMEGMATARFVCFYLLSPEGLHAVGEASPGSADRNRTLSAKAFLRISVPVPSYEVQTWFDSLYAEVDALKRLQAETAAELDAMLPAILDRAFKGEL